MNNDNQLPEYTHKWQHVKLSDSARSRIREHLTDYASFRAVRAEEEGRSMKQVPFGTFLHTLNFTHMKTMSMAVLALVLVGGGTTFAAQQSLPGDLLYPVKIGFNDEVRAALALNANAEAELQTDLFEERVKEATQLQAEGRLTGDVATKVATNLRAQAKVTADAIAKSDTAVAANANTEVQLALESVLGLVGIDTTIAADISSSLGTTLSAGTIGLASYFDDMKLRVNNYRSLMEQYQVNLSEEVNVELTEKLNSAALLVIEASGKSETDARASLDKAAVLIGEVEAKLSTLGPAQVENGMITSIDFSAGLDSTALSKSAGATSSPQLMMDGEGSMSITGTDSAPADEPESIPPFNPDAADTVPGSDAIDAVEGSIEATSGLSL